MGNVNKHKEIFKDNKIAYPWGSAICSLCKIYLCLFTPNCAWNHGITYEKFTRKNITGSQDRQNFDTSQAIFVICTHVYNFALVFHKKCTIFHPIRSTYFFHVHNYARKECLQLGHQISNIAPPLYNNSLQVNDP